MKKITFNESGLVGYHKYAVLIHDDIDEVNYIACGVDTIEKAEEYIKKYSDDEELREYITGEILEVIK